MDKKEKYRSLLPSFDLPVHAEIVEAKVHVDSFLLLFMSPSIVHSLPPCLPPCLPRSLPSPSLTFSFVH
eukprot:768815-Hanusia_phi.AAC.9